MTQAAFDRMEGVRLLLSKFDKDHSGSVSAFEFQKIAEKLGFGAVAHRIFTKLDSDGAGLVQFGAILHQMQLIADMPTSLSPNGATAGSRAQAVRSSPPTEHARRQLMVDMAHAWRAHDKTVRGSIKRLHALERESTKLSQLHTSQSTAKHGTGWDGGTTVHLTPTEQLKAYIREADLPVADLLELFNYEHSTAVDATFFQIGRDEWHRAMRERLRFTGSAETLNAVFMELDGDGDGVIDSNELFRFVQGRANALARSKSSQARRRSALQQLASGRALPFEPHFVVDDFVGAEWSVDELRREAQWLLIEARLMPYEVAAAWDSDSSGWLSQRELLIKMKKLFVPKGDALRCANGELVASGREHGQCARDDDERRERALCASQPVHACSACDYMRLHEST